MIWIAIVNALHTAASFLNIMSICMHRNYSVEKTIAHLEGYNWKLRHGNLLFRTNILIREQKILWKVKLLHKHTYIIISITPKRLLKMNLNKNIFVFVKFVLIILLIIFACVIQYLYVFYPVLIHLLDNGVHVKFQLRNRIYYSKLTTMFNCLVIMTNEIKMI